MATPPSSTEPTTATSTTSDGPVLSVITKRLRALRKKHNRIIQMEESLAQGKTLNKEQQDVLRSKPAVVTLIDELEKLRQPLSAALDEELSLALEKTQQPPEQLPQSQENQQPDNDNSVRPHQQPDDAVPDNGNEDSNGNGHDNGTGDGGYSDGDVVAVVKDLLNLMYFGSLFDVKQQSDFASLVFTRTHERGCCLSYDYVPDDATDMLSEMDLDLISVLQGLMISRPVNSTLSHQNALDKCVEHAKRWLENSDQLIDPNSNVTYAVLREKLKKIMASGYFTATPQMKGPGEVAASVAVGNFGSFSVPIHESVVNVEVPVQVEGSNEQYRATEENAANYEEYETVEHQSGDAEKQFHKDEFEHENSPEVVSAQTDREQFQNAEGEHGYRNADSKDQQYVHRRGQRGGRGGGGRRGYSSGRGRGSSRGGGPFQNGRNQHYDNYYPRNNYYNRRGSRGGSGGGGGGGYYNNSSGAPGNHDQADIGVAS